MNQLTTQNLNQEPIGWQAATVKLGAMWCDFMHDSPMWPIHGQYRCRTCGRSYAVPWAGDDLLPAR